ncbi:hypothetical protein [Bacillus mycoides]|nr:hypothetical protein [Bacillus mycoides]
MNRKFVCIKQQEFNGVCNQKINGSEKDGIVQFLYTEQIGDLVDSG